MNKIINTLTRLLRAEKPSAPPPFRLKTITTKGAGLVCDPDWKTIRSLIYEGHGG